GRYERRRRMGPCLAASHRGRFGQRPVLVSARSTGGGRRRSPRGRKDYCGVSSEMMMAIPTLGACLQRLHAITPPKGLAAFDPVSIATGQAQAILARDPAAAAQVNALVARTRQLAVDCAAFAVTLVTTHGDLNASNLIGPVPMLVDWEYAQLADPVYDL